MADSTFTGLPAGTTPLTGDEITGGDQSGTTVRWTITDARRPFDPVTIAYAASVTIDLSSYPYSPFVFDITLTGNLTINFANGFDGQVIKGRYRQNGTGGYTLSHGAAVRLSSGDSITIASGAGKVSYVGYEWCDADSKADVLAHREGF